MASSSLDRVKDSASMAVMTQPPGRGLPSKSLWPSLVLTKRMGDKVTPATSREAMGFSGSPGGGGRSAIGAVGA